MENVFTAAFSRQAFPSHSKGNMLLMPSCSAGSVYNIWHEHILECIPCNNAMEPGNMTSSLCKVIYFSAKTIWWDVQLIIYLVAGKYVTPTFPPFVHRATHHCLTPHSSIYAWYISGGRLACGNNVLKWWQQKSPSVSDSGFRWAGSHYSCVSTSLWRAALMQPSFTASASQD